MTKVEELEQDTKNKVKEILKISQDISNKLKFIPKVTKTSQKDSKFISDYFSKFNNLAKKGDLVGLAELSKKAKNELNRGNK